MTARKTAKPIALPEFNEHGVLPVGIHDASLDEIKRRFGIFRCTDRRTRLIEQLVAYLAEARDSGLVVGVIVDGSFITDKDEPGDVDIILVVDNSHDFGLDLSPAEYNVLSSRRARKRHGIDVLVAATGSDAYQRYIEFFQETREDPDVKKGLVRVQPWP